MSGTRDDEAPIAAIILAAGRSSRMGAFKPLLPFGGRTVIESVMGGMAEGGASPILVVTGHNSEALTPIVAQAGGRTVFNPDHAKGGMMASVRAGIAALGPDVDGCLMLPADLPLIRPATIVRILTTARRTGAELIHPTFRGRRGHPPFISRALFGEILDGGEETRLSDILARHRDAAVALAVIDSGIVADMDGPDDYRRLLAASAHRRHPDAAECEAMLDAIGTPEPVRAHCRAVAALALEMAGRLVEAGTPVDPDLVRAGALTHDIAKGEADHPAAGARLVEGFGFPATAAVVAVHRDIEFAPEDRPDEAAVVHLADKLIRGERRVNLDERFAANAARFADDQVALGALCRRRASADAILAALERAVGPLALARASTISSADGR